MGRDIFISHRHADKRIATVLNKHLRKWGVASKQIFQSSDSKGGAVLGGPLNQALMNALGEARLLLLVYTTADEDWSYCMWECGVATDPSRGATPTRVIVFKMTKEAPIVLRDLVSVDTSAEDEVRSFTEQFFKKSGWVNADAAFDPDVEHDTLDDHANSLFADLRNVAPTPPELKERYRWDFFSLRLSGPNLKELRESEELEDTESRHAFIRSKAEVVYDFGEALKHFGFIPNTHGLYLSNLIERWSEELSEEGDEASPRDWITELCKEMYRAIADKPSEPIWALMRSRHYKGWWFYPVVNHVRVIDNDSMEFDIYMYRLPGSLPTEAEPT